MRIRSITCFCNPDAENFEAEIKKTSALVNFCRQALKQEGWEIQSARLATPPFGHYTSPSSVIQQVQNLEEKAAESGFNYLSIGPARLSHPQEYDCIPDLLGATSNVFSSAFLTHPFKGISRDAVRACARIITRVATLSADGFTNLRFCAMSRVQPFTPFFPAAYGYGSNVAFSVAVECADAALTAFQEAKSLNAGRNNLLACLNQASQHLSPILRNAARRFQIPFKGFDFSLAPFPEDWCSLGAAMESLGVPQLGFMGSLTSAALLAEMLDRGKWKRVGFNGLMLPLLEDSRLAERSQSANFTVKDLLLYAAVCGTGLDTLPLPGDIPAERIEPLLMDLAALSLRLQKPLTARLMPVPGLKAGAQTNFDFDFFKNGNVIDFPAAALSGLFDRSKWAAIRSRSEILNG